MSADELHVNNLIAEVDVNNQSVVIASDVEHDTVIAEETRVPVSVLYILRAPPKRLLSPPRTKPAAVVPLSRVAARSHEGIGER